MQTVTKVIGLVVIIFPLMPNNNLRTSLSFDVASQPTTAKINSNFKHIIYANMFTLGIIHVFLPLFYHHNLRMLRSGYQNVEKYVLIFLGKNSMSI